MVIKPYGYAIWENMQRALDGMFKATGHVNAYFPLFIPMSFLAEGSGAWRGLRQGVRRRHALPAQGGPTASSSRSRGPSSKEPLIVRPTSETIIGDTFAHWVQSYRDLPLLINQWCNVVRWEMRTRLFLRTTEFLWQEGHTAHATSEEAVEETMRMLDVYATFAEEWMAMPVIKGEKTASERFPGAVETFCIEAMMQDRKALQAGTSHFLGQNFAKAFDVKFLDQNGAAAVRLGDELGRLDAADRRPDHDALRRRRPGVAAEGRAGARRDHSDLAQRRRQARVLEYCRKVAEELRAQRYADRPITRVVDERDERGGDKVWHWIKKGVPLRLEIGPRDIEKDALFVGRRDRTPKDKQSMPRAEFVATVATTLQSIQDTLFTRAKELREEHTRRIDTKDEFYAWFTAPKSPENAPTPIHGGFALTHFSGDVQVEERIKNDLGVTVRCIPLGEERAGHLPVHRPAEPAARRVGESLLIDPGGARARTRWLQIHFCVVLWGFTAIFGRLISAGAAIGVVAHDAGRHRVARSAAILARPCVACRRDSSRSTPASACWSRCTG